MGRRVIAPDVRGRGHSARDPNPNNYNPIVYAGDVAKLMHDLGIARAVFVGTSMGGLITMTLAVRNLDLIAGAVLNDVGPVLSPKGLARIAGYAGRCNTLSSWHSPKTRTPNGASGRSAPLRPTNPASWRCAMTRVLR
jgi:pimeloyl-ACP methyl ester carboxylesterase